MCVRCRDFALLDLFFLDMQQFADSGLGVSKNFPFGRSMVTGAGG